MDWFQAFKHAQYSVGALYLTVLNLPRAPRLKEETIILAGIIPGPKEPALNINSFLQPLIADLQKLSDGIKMFVQWTYITVHAMINLIVCDIPATRKKHMVEEAHRLLRAYCEGVEDYFGEQSCTMNMHLH